MPPPDTISPIAQTLPAAPQVTASFAHGGREHTNVPVLNPGDGHGRAWLVAVENSHEPLLLVVEAESVSDAIDVVSDDPHYGPQELHVQPHEAGGYDAETAHYDSHGRHIDDESVKVYGQEDRACPLACLYHDARLNGPIAPAYYAQLACELPEPAAWDGIALDPALLATPPTAVRYAGDEEAQRAGEKVFRQHAPLFEALAESERKEKEEEPGITM